MTDSVSPPARRILAIWCRNLAIDRWQLAEGTATEPFALVGESARGVRLVAANDAALAGGVRPQMTLADARAICPALVVAPADPAGDLAFLERLALWAQRWGPWSAPDPPDGVLVETTGVAHLHGGEGALLADAARHLGARGLAVGLAIAPTAGAAWALAHHGPELAVHHPGDSLDQLPVAALRLDPGVLLVLHRLGLKRVGDLAGVARPALARRFRNHRAPATNPLLRLDQLLGRIPEPVLPVHAAQAPMVERRLLEPIRHRDLLVRVLADLCDDMARLLEGLGRGARRLDLGLWKVDGEPLVRRLEMAAASREADHMVRLLSGRIEDIDAGFGIELVRLAAPWTEPLGLTQRDLEAAAEAHGTSLAACIDRLSVRLGEGAIRRPVARASHIPERAQTWVGEQAGVVSGSEVGKQRPLKLLDRAEPIAVLYASPDGLPRRFRWRGEVHEVLRAEGPERIAPEWWRERSTARLRDYYRVEDGKGRRYWIYRAGLAGDGRGGAPEWFLQGLHA